MASFMQTQHIIPAMNDPVAAPTPRLKVARHIAPRLMLLSMLPRALRAGATGALRTQSRTWFPKTLVDSFRWPRDARHLSASAPSTRGLAGSASPPPGGRVEAPATVPLAAVEVRASGAPVARYVQKADAAAELGLLVRDFRVVDPTFRTAGAAMLPREAGIIVRLGYVRVIILPESVLVFDPLNPHVEQFVPRLQRRLVSPSHPMPFEFRALEAVLVEVCAGLSRQLGVIVPSVDLVLDKLSEGLDFGGYTVQHCLDRLLPLENALNDFADRVDATRDALHEVLGSDEDMSLMYLTTFRETGHRRRVDQHDEVEMMLENYVKQIDTIHSEVRSTLRSIKATENITQIRLDAMRNRVLRLEVFLNLGAVSVGTGGLVAGAFGMNLLTGMEEHPLAFWIVSGSAVLTSVLMFRGCLAYLRFRKIFY